MTEDLATVPFRAGDGRRVGAAIPDISQRTACCLLQVSRSAMHRLTKGLIFQIWRFRQACRASGLAQEFITPYTPQQNGLIERLFQSLKEEGGWQHRFGRFKEARHKINCWIAMEPVRPHQALQYLSPQEYRHQQDLQLA
ncbi:integrase core domain-containing protein [Nitrospira sp. MA-1]|nr:integrase core domain-containing protein [Nitrospira sp. MA-1]